MRPKVCHTFFEESNCKKTNLLLYYTYYLLVITFFTNYFDNDVFQPTPENTQHTIYRKFSHFSPYLS